MGLFDIFKSKPQYSEMQVYAKAMAAAEAYKQRDFVKATKLFSDYFDMKGFGHFPQLDVHDYRMYLNLMLSQFYSKDYASCKKTCEKLISMRPSSGDAYAFSALCSYKLNDRAEANRLWATAKAKGNEMPVHFENIEDVRMDGFSI